MIGRIKHYLRSYVSHPRRYRSLFRTIYAERCKTIVEIGVFDGRHGVQMILSAALRCRNSEIRYFGFDLFENLTDELLQSEFSKRPPSQAEVTKSLQRTGAQIRLYKGYSQESIPSFCQSANRPEQVDFIFIDGGHSVETVRADWDNIQPLVSSGTIVIFDDYYESDDEFLLGKGCNAIVNSIDNDRYRVEILPYVDEFQHDWGVLRVRMILVEAK